MPREIHRVTQRREEAGGRQRWPEGEEGEQKGREQASQQSLPYVLSQPRTPRVSLRVKQRRGGGGEREATWRKGERAIKTVITPLKENGY